MSRRRTLSTKKKVALFVTAAAVAGGGAFAMAATSNAAQSAADSSVCQGLATALGNNERFIADQKANPDAQSAARIANREAVIAQIKVQQGASDCVVGESAQGSQAAQPAQPSAPAAETGGSAQDPQGDEAAGNAGGAGGADAGDTGNAGAGEQVCNGSTVTLSGEGGTPAASSNEFPAGTKLRVTNLDNNKSTTVEVTSVSGSCVLLNNAAFEQVREPGKFLIRRALIEKVG
ncbi:septal ring lytic transglycosylase RlpA family protein [Streptomyces sp. MNU76]|uniref:septal ring lytic transglycosylase RlpA family protein n=1 Tax=Streptomyces sp. MNU76 TaxID=2560026 RepID=UPI001E58D3E4|nr:septal ring lytic transglycosylase RlpA family protein [Streptomyces sp. MNU76]MCC9704691.1 septal ring lytic transglycosylase RlpA family protein [Streptomyces sp. MNU76]